MHALIGQFADPDNEGGARQVAALVAAGYRVFAINPMRVARYRERRTTSGAKSDGGDGHALADMVRTDAHQLRRVAGDTALAEGIKVVGRGPQSMIGDRQRQVLWLRSTLREFFPVALEAFEDLTAPALDEVAKPIRRSHWIDVGAQRPADRRLVGGCGEGPVRSVAAPVIAQAGNTRVGRRRMPWDKRKVRP